MLRLDRNSKNKELGRPFVKMSVNCHRHVQDADIIDGHAFPYNVDVNLDMLHALVLNGVGGEVDGTDVVTVDEGALRQRSVELLK
jgi:hypothetical protein